MLTRWRILTIRSHIRNFWLIYGSWLWGVGSAENQWKFELVDGPEWNNMLVRRLGERRSKESLNGWFDSKFACYHDVNVPDKSHSRGWRVEEFITQRKWWHVIGEVVSLYYLRGTGRQKLLTRTNVEITPSKYAQIAYTCLVSFSLLSAANATWKLDIRKLQKL